MKKSYLSKLFALVVCLGMSYTLTYGQFNGTLEVTAPAGVAGTYTAGDALLFGDVGGTVTGELVLATDVGGATTGCGAIDNGVTDVTGKIALIDRGVCAFTQKAFNAEQAGAIGVIICNNDTANPDAVINLGGFTCAVTIPVGMISYNDCQALRMETGVMGTFTSGIPVSQPNEYIGNAIPITDGTYTVDSISGEGGLFTNSVGNVIYSYTATADGALNINSCLGGADTRLWVINCAGTALGTNDDACDLGNGDEYASNLDLIVRAGQQVFLVWDDRWSTDGFDFTVTLNPLPAVDVTFTVDMKNETVSGDGVNMVWAFNGTTSIDDVEVLALTDNADGTWSGTLTLTALDTIGYAFMNGMLDLANIEAVPDECGLPSGFGFNIRPLIVESLTAIELGNVCFSTCTSICPVPVDVSFTVDVSNQMVSGDGIKMIWAFNDAASIDDVEVVDLTDNGNGTWSGTVTLTALDTIGYAFMNGLLDLANIEAVPDDCGLPSGFGFNIRPLIVDTDQDFSVPTVCFSTCLGACPGDCGEAPVLLENLDGYTAGEYVGPQSPLWTTWSGAGGEGTPEDAFVSDAQAHSAPNSILIEGQNGPTDLVLDLGQRSEGNWYLSFWMYVPSGRYAYYNIQNELPFNDTQWNLEVDFNVNSDGQIIESGATVANFSFPHDTWFQVIHRIDLDNDNAALIVDGVNVWNWEYGPNWDIGSFDFYPNANGPNQWYLDDIELRPLDPCPEGAIICDGFEAYTEGPVSDQSADWAPWTSSPADDGVVQADPGFVRSGCQSLVIDDGDPDDQLLLLGDRTSGNYLLEWYMYVPAGRLGYYNLQKFQDNPGATGGFALQVEWFADGTVTVDAGAADVVTFNWTPDTWMHVQHFIDLDNNWISLVVDDAVIYEWPANWQTFATTGVKQLGSVDFFGNTNVTYYLDDVLFQQLPAMPGNLCAGAQNVQGQFGQGLDNTVSSGPYDNTDYTTTSQDPDFGYECFGEPDGLGGAPSLERTMWFTFVGDGETYFLEAVACGDNPIGDGDTQMAVYSGNCGNLTAVDCSEDGPNAMSGGPYPAGLELATEAGVTYYVMIDGFGPDFEQFGEYCLEVTQLTNVVTVTFNVDMALVDMVDPAGVHIAGSFQGWDPGATPLTDNGDGTWSVTVTVEPDQTIMYKFINGNMWGQDETNITEECGVLGGAGSYDRVLEVGAEDIETIFYCFDYCVTCDMVDAVDEQALQAGVHIFPNPVKELLNVRVELPEAADNLSVRMLNAFGQVVKESYYGALQTANIEIDVTNIPAGAYMIQVRDGKAQYTQSVIVE